MLARVWRSPASESPHALQPLRTDEVNSFSVAKAIFPATTSSSFSWPSDSVISFFPLSSLCAATLPETAMATCVAWQLELASLPCAFLIFSSSILLCRSESVSDSPIRPAVFLMVFLRWFARERATQRRRQRRKRARENAGFALAFALRPPAPQAPALPSAWRRAPVPDARWRSTCLRVKGKGR